jgi:Uma2 family endonuclease
MEMSATISGDAGERRSVVSIVRPTEDGLVRIPMSWEEYLTHDELVPSEYYEGALVLMNHPRRHHQVLVVRLLDLLRETKPADADVTPGWGWSPPDVREELIPDLMVHPVTAEDHTFTGTPLLVVEVLSSNRRDDLFAKFVRYARWGARHYWVVDPRDRLLLAFDNHDGTFVETGRHTAGRVRIPYADVVVPVDLDELLAP